LFHGKNMTTMTSAILPFTNPVPAPDLISCNGAEAVLKILAENGVDTIFGYPGGAVLPIYDALFKQDKIKHILVRHEQAAVHGAEGYARSTGKLGVVLVTSGPGATNAVTGLTDALMDSVPVLCLTGQVPTHLIGNDAFQEADTTGITRPCTKHNYLVKDANDIARVVREAIFVATNGRPGPVVIDLPKDILFAPTQYLANQTSKPRAYRPQVQPHQSAIEQAVALLRTAKRPILYGGGGIINSGDKACQLLRQFIAETGIPCTLTLMGLGALPASNPQFLGMLGMHGTWEANHAMHQCDVMLNVGARFDDRVTGKLSGFSPNSKKIHLDIDPSSINKTVMVDIPVVGDIAASLEALLAEWHRQQAAFDAAALKDWWAHIANWRSIDCLAYRQESDVIKPQHAIKRLWELTKHKTTYISTEVGQHQMWAAQYYGFEEPKRWLTSGGLGTMGYGLPAAMGVQVAHPDALVIDIAGEASILMNIQEMSTLVQYRLPVKVFIINNRWMGMVRQWQELLHGSRYSQSYSEALPDFVKLAEAFGAVGLRAERADQLDDVINEMVATNRPVIADICVDQKENCYPMIPSGANHNEMLLGQHDKTEQKVSDEGMMLV
jgi:acetolactate synthase I/II/III large subunit